MLFKTRGIVLNFIKYKETSIIVKIFTEEFGLQSYIVNSVRTKNTKTGIALYQPLTLLDLVVYHKSNKSINRISEIKCNSPFKSIPYDIKKTSIALFITEILSRTVKIESFNKQKFEFLYSSIKILDELETNFENFHIIFLIRLSKYLGFEPQSAQEIVNQIHSWEKQYIDNNIQVKHDSDLINMMNNYLSSGYNDVIKSNNLIRNNIIDLLIKFYSLHIESIGEIKSLQVLREVLK